MKKIGKSWLAVDFDGVGKATVDEIQVRFQRYDATRKAELEREKGIAKSGVPSDKLVDATRPLPAEFAKLDADGDGQVEMHEFAKTFDASVVHDFYQRDINRDGVISLNEWNRFLAGQNKASANPPTTTGSDRDRK